MRVILLADATISISIPLRCFHNTPPAYEACPILKGAKAHGQLKFASNAGAAPFLECQVKRAMGLSRMVRLAEMPRQLSHVPPTSRGGQLQYFLTYRLKAPEGGDNSMIALFSSVSILSEISLTRRSATRPIEHPRDGRIVQFASYEISKGTSRPVRVMDQVGEIGGVVTVPANVYTAYSCGAEVEYGLYAKIKSPSLREALNVRCPVHIPASVECT